MGDLATIGVAIVGLAGGYVGGQQKAKGDLNVAREETARLREEIDAKRFEHRTGLYHNILALAAKLEHGALPGSVYRGGEGWAVNEKFKEEVDGLAVFGASEPRKHALAMRRIVDERVDDDDPAHWLERFKTEKQAFMDAAHADVGPHVRDVGDEP
jgi:hypothetical protein